MKFSLVALIGLAAFAGNFGADARALPNDLALSSSSVAARDAEIYAVEKTKRGPPLPPPVVPKPPTLPKPPTIPRPGERPGDNPGGEPAPIVPEPVTPPGAPKPPTAPRPPGAPKPPEIPSCSKLRRWERLIGRACQNVADVPEVDVIKAKITNPTGKYLFYSGPGDRPGEGYIKKANDWINKQLKGSNDAKKGYKKLDQSWNDPQYPDNYQMNAGPGVADAFNTRASIAYAQKAEGVVYVLLPKDTTGTSWQAGTVWADHEWPNMGPGVTKIIRVNPEDDTEEVIYTKPGTA